MQPRRHSVKIQRPRSARASRADIRRSREIEVSSLVRSEIYRVIDEAKLLSLLKFGGEPKDAIVNVEVRVTVVLVF